MYMQADGSCCRLRSRISPATPLRQQHNRHTNTASVEEGRQSQYGLMLTARIFVVLCPWGQGQQKWHTDTHQNHLVAVTVLPVFTQLLFLPYLGSCWWVGATDNTDGGAL